MKHILNVVALLIVIGGGLILYQMLMGEKVVRIVEKIQHRLNAAEELVLGRDNMKFSETRNYKAGLAHINYLYTWEANVPFGVSPKELSLSYEESTKRLDMRVEKLSLFPFKIINKKAEATSESFWLDRGGPKAEFWEKVDDLTKDEIDNELENKPELRDSIGKITRLSLKDIVRNILSDLNLGGINVTVSIGELELYNKEMVAIKQISGDEKKGGGG